MGFLRDILNPFDTKHPIDNPGGYLLGKYAFKGQNKADPKLNAVQVNRSAYGLAVPLVYGQTRIPISLAWYGGFTAISHTEKQQGGKGGGGKNTNTTYTYTASVIGILCEGQINSLGTYWVDKEKHTSLSDLSLTLFSGAGSQSVWSYLTTNFPSQAIPYDHTAYIAAASMDLGSSASLPNLSFEVRGLQCFTPSSFDAEPSDILIDYCTEPNHGCNFPYLATIQGAGTTTYESYCIAMGFLISPQETQQRAAVSFIREMLQITNSDAVWSPGTGLKIIPYADQSVTNNGRTYTPDLAPVYAFGDSDYIFDDGEDPVVIQRTPSSQTYNKVRVEYLDRDHDYNTAIAEASDDQDIALNGERVMETVTLHAITTTGMARLVAQFLLQRQLYIRNTFRFKVRADYSLLEPMDLVSITDSYLGILNQLVRIIQTDDDEDDVFMITAEEMLVGTASAPLYNTQANAGYIANYAVAPGAVQTPLILTAPQYLVDVNGGYEVWIALAGTAHATWGGCHVYASLDNVSFAKMGTHYGPSRYGSLTATFASGSDPDTSSTLSVSLADNTMSLVSGTQADADEMRTLLYVDGEICSYRYATLTGVGAYTFTSNGTSGGTKYMRRGKYGSAIASHASGTKWARIDDGLFRMQYDPGSIGKTLYLKFQSFNVYGSGLEDLASATVYSHVLADANAGSLLPGNSTFVARGNCATVGDSFFKSGGSGAWDSDVYSIEAYSGGCVLKFRAAQTNASFLVGINSDPTTDQSYSSLDHAIFCSSSSSALQIYENGSLIVSIGTYTKNTSLSITYDGITVRYYKDGILQREVQNPGKVFFADSSFFDPGAAAVDVFFGSSISAPSARLIARGQCIVVGNSIQKQGGSSAWDSDCYSTETFTGGCSVSWRFQAAAIDNYFMGLNSDPTTDQHYNSLDFAFQLVGSNAGGPACYIIESASTVAGPLTAAANDVFSIRYDGQWVRYYRNGTVVREKFAPGLTLFLDSSFYSPGCVALDVNFGPLTGATPSPFIARGNCTVSDTNVIKQGGSSAWDSDCSSIVGYPICHVAFKGNESNTYKMIGLNTDPTADQNYTSIDFCWYLRNDAVAEIYESASAVGGTASSYDEKTAFAISYDGSNVRYYKDAVLIRTIAASSLTLFMDSSFYSPYGGINSLRFGPTTNLAVTDTAQIGQNAATKTGSATMLGGTTSGIANGVTVRSTTCGTSDNAEVTIPSPPYDCTVIVTITYWANIFFPGNSIGAYVRAAFSDNNGSTWSYGTERNDLPNANQAAAGGNSVGAVQHTFAHSAANAGPMKADIALENQTGGSIQYLMFCTVQMEVILR
jgi:hypothetical protein